VEVEETRSSAEDVPRKETKGDKKKKERAADFREIWEYWNSCNIIVHREMTEAMIGKMNARMDAGYAKDEIINAIRVFNEISVSPEYYWEHRNWTLVNFLQRGLELFENEENAKAAYRHKGGINGQSVQRNQRPSGTRMATDHDWGW